MQPANELARMVDCAMAWSEPLGGHVPRRDANMQTSVPGVSVVGDAAGVGDAGSAILAGAGRGGGDCRLAGEEEAAIRPVPRDADRSALSARSI